MWPIVTNLFFRALAHQKRDYGGYFANKKKREKGQLPHMKIGDQYNLKTKLGAKILEKVDHISEHKNDIGHLRQVDHLCSQT